MKLGDNVVYDNKAWKMGLTIIRDIKSDYEIIHSNEHHRMVDDVFQLIKTVNESYYIRTFFNRQGSYQSFTLIEPNKATELLLLDEVTFGEKCGSITA